ncbi:hypothetical protein GEV33_002540 [Tenebrio molitor]|uniref:Uncharacterized protein n=1 Tax=Tenebrio molitor TaxID=7067 RepID=A0A8J6LPB0_TENMO|nr:hypothetical protein GEV33_002540 [Tenebrio molitor]
MRCSCNYRDALSPNGIRSRSFVGNERTLSATAERAAVPQVASCESRAWRLGSAIIPEGGLPNAMALIVRRCQPSGPSRSPKIYRTATVYRLPWSRNPSSSSEIEEYRKVLLQFIAEQPLSAERVVIARPHAVLLDYRSMGRSFAISFFWGYHFEGGRCHIVELGRRQTKYRSASFRSRPSNFPKHQGHVVPSSKEPYRKPKSRTSRTQAPGIR